MKNAEAQAIDLIFGRSASELDADLSDPTSALSELRRDHPGLVLEMLRLAEQSRAVESPPPLAEILVPSGQDSMTWPRVPLWVPAAAAVIAFVLGRFSTTDDETKVTPRPPLLQIERVERVADEGRPMRPHRYRRGLLNDKSVQVKIGQS